MSALEKAQEHKRKNLLFKLEREKEIEKHWQDREDKMFLLDSQLKDFDGISGIKFYRFSPIERHLLDANGEIVISLRLDFVKWINEDGKEAEDISWTFNYFTKNNGHGNGSNWFYATPTSIERELGSLMANYI